MLTVAKVYQKKLSRLKSLLEAEQDKMNGNAEHDKEHIMMARSYSNDIHILEQQWYDRNHPQFSKDGEPAEPIY